MSHKVQCQCGKLVGEVTQTERASRCVCYCRDCQAFAIYLGQPAQTLDENGGTDIVQTNPATIRFLTGVDHLGCLRLSKKGLIRWYATCCNTPIGNTLATRQLPFVGLVHTCLTTDERTLSERFGEVSAVVNTGSASGETKPQAKGMPAYIFKAVGLILSSRFGGSYQKNPFFDASTGRPVSTPTVLSPAERSKLN